MKSSLRVDEAYRTGKSAAVAGQAKSSYEGLYKKNSELLSAYVLGYSDGLKELARARRLVDKNGHYQGGDAK